MLTTLKNAFKIKEIRQKILFTLGMLVVIRIGSQLPYSPCGGQTAAGHLALVCGTEALRLKRPYNKPI